MTKSFVSKSFSNKLRQAGLILSIATTISVFTSHQSFAFSAEAFAGTLTDLYMPKKK